MEFKTKLERDEMGNVAFIYGMYIWHHHRMKLFSKINYSTMITKSFNKYRHYNNMKPHTHSNTGALSCHHISNPVTGILA